MEAFDPAEIAQYALNNAAGISLLTITYLRSRGLSVADWARWVGSEFAGPETNWVPGMAAQDMAREAAKELLSMKANVLEISGDDDASMVLFVWPSDESLHRRGLRREDVQDIWLTWEPLAASVGLRARTATSSDGVTTLAFSRP
ncbi:MAG TPA: hypothetical protein VH561_02645 [Micromonosporaceae bacterium]|jgi:hypothetical protein